MFNNEHLQPKAREKGGIKIKIKCGSNIFGYQVLNNDRLCSLNDDKIIHTLKILTYRPTRAYLSFRVQLTENHLPSGILGITVCNEQHKKKSF